MSTALKRDVDVILEVSSIVMNITGVQLGEKQRLMVASRLKKRMMELNLKDELDYYEYLNKNRHSETNALISLLTTHHTYFFREPGHFDYLEREGLPKIIQQVRDRGDKVVRVWSAACSTGQEVYTLAMFLHVQMKTIAPDLSFEILGSDVDPKSVAFASNGVYSFDEIKEIPIAYQTHHWVRGTGEISNFVKAKESIRKPCKFETRNLLKWESKYETQKFDIIFCRNVFIYFTPPQIKEIVKNFSKCLQAGGVLAIGVSESLNGLELPFKLKGPSIYVSTDSLPAKASSTTTKTAQSIAPVITLPKIIKVLCVDDSPTVLSLLKKILSTDGFEVVGTAMNGLQAAEFLKKNKVDAVTLDIHMPEQTGLEYLKANFRSDHPPVIMVSSVSRENADLAQKCLAEGASDYVEKPALNNFEERSDELKMKIHASVRAKVSGNRNSLKLDQSFSKHPVIKNAELKLRVIFGSLVDRKRVALQWKEYTGTDQPPSIFLIEGAGSALLAIQEENRKLFPVETFVTEGLPPKLEKNKIYFVDFKSIASELKRYSVGKVTSILVFGDVTASAREYILDWKGAHLLVEDLRPFGKVGSLDEVAADVVPITSFPYMSTEYLSKGDAK